MFHKIINNIKIKYFAVGILNTLFGYTLFILLIKIELNYLIAQLIATIFGLCFNFFSYGNLIFKIKNKYIFMKFIFSIIISYIFNSIALYYLHTYLFLSSIVAAFILIPPTLVFNFILHKNYVFR